MADQFYLDALKEISLENTNFDLKTYMYIVAVSSDGSIRIFQWNDWSLIFKTVPLNKESYGSLKRDNFDDIERNFMQHPSNKNRFVFYEF